MIKLLSPSSPAPSNLSTHNKGSWLVVSSSLIVLCSALLLAIWPLPGTIALRHVLLGIGFITSLILLQTDKSAIFNVAAWPFWVFLGFYLWLLVHLFFFSTDFDAQLYELGHLWMRSLLAVPLGLALGLMLVKTRILSVQTEGEVSADNFWENICILLILIGFSGTCLIGFGRYAYEVWHTHQWINDQILFVFYKAKPPFVICVALAAPLSFILIIRGINHQISRWWIVAGLLIAALCIFGTYFSNTKNGVALFVLCLIVFAINLVMRIQWEWKRTTLTLLISAVIASYSFVGIQKHLEKNMAWAQMIADIKVGVDIGNQNSWKDYQVGNPPINSLATPVDGSTYLRTAWFVAGAQLLSENPFGYGLVHHSFGALAKAKWPDFSKPLGNMRGATHSAWMDFALGLGIPGLLLVLMPLGVAWYRSLYQKGLWFSYVAWTIPILSFAYLTTEANEAHFIELLFFMTAFFCGITLRYPRTTIHNHADAKNSH